MRFQLLFVTSQRADFQGVYSYLKEICIFLCVLLQHLPLDAVHVPLTHRKCRFSLLSLCRSHFHRNTDLQAGLERNVTLRSQRNATSAQIPLHTFAIVIQTCVCIYIFFVLFPVFVAFSQMMNTDVLLMFFCSMNAIKKKIFNKCQLLTVVCAVIMWHDVCFGLFILELIET